MSRLSYKTLFTIVTILFVLIVLLLKIRSHPSPVKATWYNSSWSYRQSVTVTSAVGSTLTNYDILLSLDTATLISAGKMQSDCDDIRFTDSDETTLLNHWIEGGCNTTTTQIWIRLPNIPSGGKTIYVYYANPAAANAEQSWSGNFVLIGTTTCPTGWTRYSALDSRFPYGASSVGTTGGASSHTQPDISATSSTYSTALEYQNYFNDVLYAASHTHAATVTINSASVLPPYLDTMYCSNPDLNIGASQVVLFDVSPPTGWTRYSALDSRFPRGNSAIGTTGGASTHNHSYNGGTTGLNSAPYYAVGSGFASPDAAEGNHSHSWTGGNTSTENNLPPYLTMIYASKNSAGVGTSAMITLSTATPPLGWTRFTSLDNKFPMGSASYGTTAGATTHTHSVSITTGNNDRKANPAGGPGIYLTTSPHTHTISGTSVGSNTPPYYTMIFIKRNSPTPTTSAGTEVHQNSPPSIPVLTLPVNSAISQSLIPTFKTVTTDADNDYLQYELKICTNSAMTAGCQTFDQTSSNIGWSGQDVGTSAFSSGTTATYILQVGNSLSFNTTYYWKTRATDPAGYAFRYLDGTNTWSDYQVSPFTFNTNFSPTMPTIISPANLATTQPLTSPTFRLVTTDVDNDPLQYKIKLCRNSSMTLDCLIFDQTTSSVGWSGIDIGTSAFSSGTTAAYIYSGSLLPGITYYWQSWAIDPNGTNLWSATQNPPVSFTTANLPAPQNCLIEESSDETWLKIKWLDTSPSETAYAIDRKVDGGLYVNLTTALSAGTTDYTDPTVSSGHTYQYRVTPILPGPIYGQWCETSTLNLQTNNTLKFDNLQFDSLKIN